MRGCLKYFRLHLKIGCTCMNSCKIKNFHNFWDVCHMARLPWVNLLAPGKFEWNFRYVIFNWILVIDCWDTSWQSCETVLIWMPQDFTDDQSTLFQVMAWCRRATSHYLSQCWPRSLSPYGVTRPQWVKDLIKPNLPSFNNKTKQKKCILKLDRVNQDSKG